LTDFLRGQTDFDATPEFASYQGDPELPHLKGMCIAKRHQNQHQRDRKDQNELDDCRASIGA
jgi:hypothetical protein